MLQRDDKTCRLISFSVRTGLTVQCIFHFSWHKSNGLMVRASVSHAAGPSSDPVGCLFKLFVLPEFSGKWTAKFRYRSFQRRTLPEFCSPFTVKTAPEKTQPFTFCTATLRSICRNYPVNLKQCAIKTEPITDDTVARVYTLYSRAQ